MAQKDQRGPLKLVQCSDNLIKDLRSSQSVLKFRSFEVATPATTCSTDPWCPRLENRNVAYLDFAKPFGKNAMIMATLVMKL